VLGGDHSIVLGELRAFAGGAADAFSPVPLPHWLSGRR